MASVSGGWLCTMPTLAADDTWHWVVVALLILCCVACVRCSRGLIAPRFCNSTADRLHACCCVFSVATVSLHLQTTHPTHLGHDTHVFNMPYDEKPKGMRSSTHQYHSTMRGVSWKASEDSEELKKETK